MRVPKVRILGLRFNDLAYLLTMTIEIKYSSVTGKTIVKTHISHLIQLIKIFHRTKCSISIFKRNGGFWEVNKKLASDSY